MAKIRNAPTQDRSRQTLDDILSAADQLFAKDSVDGVTNGQIAEQAGCSIGSFYRFFSNKEELVSEYVDRYLLRLADSVPVVPDNLDFDNLEEAVSVLIDRSVKAYALFPGFEQVRLWRYADGTLASKVVRDSEIALLSNMLRRFPYDLPPELISRMAIVMVDGAWPLLAGLNSTKPKERAVMIEEIKFSLDNYVRARIQKHLDELN